MKNIASWPKPPIFESTEPPKIPENYKVFGIEFKVIDNEPIMYQNSKPKKFDKDLVHKYLEESYKTFKQIISNIITNRDNTIEATKLLDIHTEINTYLNECREDEAIRKIQNSIAIKIKDTNENIEQLNKLTYDSFLFN